MHTDTNTEIECDDNLESEYESSWNQFVRLWLLPKEKEEEETHRQTRGRQMMTLGRWDFAEPFKHVEAWPLYSSPNDNPTPTVSL